MNLISQNFLEIISDFSSIPSSISLQCSPQFFHSGASLLPLQIFKNYTENPSKFSYNCPHHIFSVLHLSRLPINSRKKLQECRENYCTHVGKFLVCKFLRKFRQLVKTLLMNLR